MKIILKNHFEVLWIAKVEDVNFFSNFWSLFIYNIPLPVSEPQSKSLFKGSLGKVMFGKKPWRKSSHKR